MWGQERQRAQQSEMTRRETAETQLGTASGSSQLVGCPASGQGAASLGHDGLSMAFWNVCTFPGRPESQVWAVDDLPGAGYGGVRWATGS